MTATFQTKPTTVTADMLWELTTQYPESEQRIWRGAEMVALVERTATPGLFLVGSAQNPDAAYQVDAAGCSCYDFQKRGGFCKHRAARALFIAAERAETDAEQLIAITVEPEDKAIPYELAPICILCRQPVERVTKYGECLPCVNAYMFPDGA